MKQESVERFRGKLQNILDSVEDDDSPYTKGVRAVVKALKHDYDIIFPKEAWDTNADVWRLVDKYCHKSLDRCPICGSAMQQKLSKAGNPFRGCGQYPVCQGCRSQAGRPSINESMRIFLSEKVEEELKELHAKQTNRFRNLDFDE